ncbi:phage virion morphogenesis protein [Sphingomonas sp. 8AM]|uniref:phage virion morphogenesis protein n=1 Tax=Sphingomonas sp. 8AM TaxID=2653170 RepID=UPI0012F2005D|nr:phage virion morphogenesis protein [Sphingomonas sp. 8AM]VXC90677.1 putative Phage virion morphogenesis (tail completion) protein [Sphingomonas sp. 8AM]
MSDGLDEIERLARSCLRSVGASERRQILRGLARDIRQSQSDRIAAQREPDGSAFAPRKPREAEQGGGYTVKFLYPKGAAEPRLVIMKSWVRQGPLLTGFDSEAGAIRSFFWDKVAQWLPVEGNERVRSGKLRRRGAIKSKAMFRRLRTARYLKNGATADEAWVGWMGGASTIASIHQEGGSDRPAKKGKAVRYARRILLGLTAAERSMLVDRLLNHTMTS